MKAAYIANAIYNRPKALESLDTFQPVDHLDESFLVTETSMKGHNDTENFTSLKNYKKIWGCEKFLTYSRIVNDVVYDFHTRKMLQK